MNELYREYEGRLKSANTEQEVLSVLIAAISDEEINRIGGPLYNGYGEELGDAAAQRLLEIRKPQTPKISNFDSGMSVAELKEIVNSWPDADEHGEPCEVWMSDGNGLSNQASRVTPLNMRRSEDGSKVWADLMLGYTSSKDHSEQDYQR